MSDVRSLLRQQRAARRIEHPFAVYSDAGKLLCTLCREQLKSESQWDAHLLGQPHKQRLQQRKASTTSATTATTHDESGSNKRKLDSAGMDVDAEDDAEMRDAVRRKRSKPDITPLTGIGNGLPPFNGDTSDSLNTPDQIPSAGSNNSKDSTRTPPGLVRRTSTTPSQGIELQIPSRPATPAHRDGGSSSASASGGYFAVQSQNGPSTPLAPPRNSSASNPGHGSGPALASTAQSSSKSSTVPVDESEWAAFEADIAAASAPYDTGAVISAPAMTTEEAAAKEAEDAANLNRKLQADVDIEDEKEEAKRALEDEFEEMKGLEERIDKLKELRAEFLKKRSKSHGQVDGLASVLAEGKQNGGDDAIEENEGEGDDDEEEDDDDWDSFRFRR
ncbi:hypothetical protein QQS21_008086 [Conoideocrella luteorostrata]|uniref:U1-type domain-containing protein n=1 Tax=Conoideocrella luteorostrata TaxID=1105319 RepID=A0AAJ0CKC9_9HYPO|nr:hypothetical protein QQS21_008086 [Conoideocrella luteorostrata]